MNLHFNLLWRFEQEWQNQEPLGTETRMGLRQNKWYPLSHLSHRRSFDPKSPDPHSWQLTPSYSESDPDPSSTFRSTGFGAWVLRLSTILAVGLDAIAESFKEISQICCCCNYLIGIVWIYLCWMKWFGAKFWFRGKWVILAPLFSVVGLPTPRGLNPRANFFFFAGKVRILLLGLVRLWPFWVWSITLLY